MTRTIARFVGLPFAVAAAAVALSATSASAQLSDVAPKLDVDVVVTHCSINSIGYGQFQACVAAALTP
ncbi:hypothetical protein [Nocardia sp. NBC_00416]|uniref:hypothetical protein n=1 Tax=Nocardia sp. NBC_00416 TaxID=2975991 RepID=UPI002E1F433E